MDLDHHRLMAIDIESKLTSILDDITQVVQFTNGFCTISIACIFNAALPVAVSLERAFTLSKPLTTLKSYPELQKLFSTMLGKEPSSMTASSLDEPIGKQIAYRY